MLARLPNVVTSLRIAALPLLAWLAATHQRGLFAAVLIACLASDVLDGALARALRAASPVGARLDSIADTLLFFTAAAGIVALYPDEVLAHPVAFGAGPAAWLAENTAAVVRYGRLSSFHTYLSRAAALVMGVFAAVLFVSGLQPWLLHLAAGALLVAAVEELVLLWLLPVWRADVRGVYWVLERRRSGASGARAPLGSAPLNREADGRESPGTAAIPRPR